MASAEMQMINQCWLYILNHETVPTTHVQAVLACIQVMCMHWQAENVCPIRSISSEMKLMEHGVLYEDVKTCKNVNWKFSIVLLQFLIVLNISYLWLKAWGCSGTSIHVFLGCWWNQKLPNIVTIIIHSFLGVGGQRITFRMHTSMNSDRETNRLQMYYLFLSYSFSCRISETLYRWSIV
jgi:hypothetical protein